MNKKIFFFIIIIMLIILVSVLFIFLLFNQFKDVGINISKPPVTMKNNTSLKYNY